MYVAHSEGASKSAKKEMMGFVAATAAPSGSSFLLHSPLYPFPFSSSSRHRRAPIVSCSRHHDPICNKRSFLLFGVAVLPLLPLKTAPALEGSLTTPSKFDIDLQITLIVFQ